MSSLTPADVARLARLARIELSDAELGVLAPQLSQILDSVAQVQQAGARRCPGHLPPAAADQCDPGGCRRPAAGGRGRPRRRPGGAGRPVPGAADSRRGTVSTDTGLATAPDLPADLTRASAAQLAASIADGTVSAVEVARAHLDRIAAVDPEVHAFLHVDADNALAAAADVDAHRAAGDALGPLAGVPLALKDLFVQRGVPTTAGSRTLAGWRPPYDATVVSRLHEAGVVILGKTNLDEFAMGSSTENSAFGPTHNPWDTDRVPGGSGGGSAASLAAFQAPLAIGTDTGGSIRQPAAFTGTVGVKPTYGGVSRLRDHRVGQFAGPGRAVRAFGAGRGPAARGSSPVTTPGMRPPSIPLSRPWWRRARSGDVSGMRIGVVRELSGEGYQPGVEQRFTEAVAALSAAGADVVEVSLPAFHLRAGRVLPDPAE